MRQNIKKSMMMFRMLTLALLLIGMLVFVPGPINADDPDSPLIEEPNRIGNSGAGLSGSSGKGNSVIHTYSSSSGFIFEQPPITRADPYWFAFTSDRHAEYLCMDDFWGLTNSINDVHWYGGTGIFDEEEGDWLIGSPSGMQFEIIFYADNGGSPGAIVADFPNLNPMFGIYDTLDDFDLYRFDVTGLNFPVSLTAGWVSIQSTYSPNGSEFLWLISNTGNENAIQNGVTIDEEETGHVNLAFALTKASPMGVGGEVRAVNTVKLLIPWAGLAIVLILAGYLTVKMIYRRRADKSQLVK